MMGLTLTRLPGRPADWDALIERYDSKTLFHESCWLDHIATIHPRGRIEYLRIQDGGDEVGHFCAFAVRRFLLRVWGSPLPGTGTFFMGPVVDRSIDTAALLGALLDYCRANGVKHLELASDILDPDAARRCGMQVDRAVTRLCSLPVDERAAWGSLKSTCRNRIRKAEQNGLVAELADDPQIVDHFYAQYRQVWAKQGLSLPFPIDRPRSLYEHLMPRGRLLPVWVKYQGRVIASGLFPHDDRCVYFWGGASWTEYQHLHPNELLHWTVMRLAAERGVPFYNMYGSKSQFKEKFGGAEVPAYHFSKSFLPMLAKARELYQAAHRRRRKRKSGSRSAPPAARPAPVPGGARARALAPAERP